MVAKSKTVKTAPATDIPLDSQRMAPGRYKVRTPLGVFKVRREERVEWHVERPDGTELPVSTKKKDAVNEIREDVDAMLAR